MKYADVDLEENMRLLAERLGWPGGALEACLALEAAHPGWRAYWSRGPYGRPPQPGFRVRYDDGRGYRPAELYAEDPAELPARMAEVEEARPAWPARLTPLSPPR